VKTKLKSSDSRKQPQHAQWADVQSETMRVGHDGILPLLMNLQQSCFTDLHVEGNDGAVCGVYLSRRRGALWWYSQLYGITAPVCSAAEGCFACFP
jgi:hypothetical protein